MNTTIVPFTFTLICYTIRAYSLEHKKRYNIVIIGEDKYIYVLQQVRTDFPLRV